MKGYINKKVLLRERKRHTARCVASACYAALSPDVGWRGYPIQSWMGGTPYHEGWGPPSAGWGTPCLDLGRGYPHLDLGRGYPLCTWDGVPPCQEGWDTPQSTPGMGVPPPIWTWVTVHPPPCQLDGVPSPPKVGKTHTCENITSRHPSNAGGNKVGWYRDLGITSKFSFQVTYPHGRHPGLRHQALVPALLPPTSQSSKYSNHFCSFLFFAGNRNISQRFADTARIFPSDDSQLMANLFFPNW